MPSRPCQKAGAAVASVPPGPENDAAAKGKTTLRMLLSDKWRHPIRLLFRPVFGHGC
jgi:hypothetical protein